jgi:hypothetical protein
MQMKATLKLVESQLYADTASAWSWELEKPWRVSSSCYLY